MPLGRIEADAQALQAGDRARNKGSRAEQLFEAQGHLLGVRKSKIPGAGRGLFLIKGSIKKGEVGFCAPWARGFELPTEAPLKA